MTTATLTDEIVEQLRHDVELVSLVTEKLGLSDSRELWTVDDLSDNGEDYVVECKSTARWDLREDRLNKAMECPIAKTVAGFLNAAGETLLIGINPDRQVVGFNHDYARPKPQNGDGLVNRLTTHDIDVPGHGHESVHCCPWRSRDLPNRHRCSAGAGPSKKQQS